MPRELRIAWRLNGPLTLIALVASLVAHPSCGGPPAGPIPPPPIDRSDQPDLPAPAVPQIAAALAIEHLSIEESPPTARQPEYSYLVRFRLRETGGSSGATIKEVAVAVGGNTALTNGDCWLADLRVPPGGMLDTFFTDEGLAWLAYCSAGIGSLTPLDLVRVTVLFEDDDARDGSVTSTVKVLR